MASTRLQVKRCPYVQIPRLTEGAEPFRTDLIRCAAIDVLSIMVEDAMMLLKESYRIPSDIGLMVALNRWSQMVGGLYLWFRHLFGLEMPLHVFHTVYQLKKLPKKKGKDKELDALPRCQLSNDVIEVFWSIYQASLLNRRYGFLLDRQRYLIELGLMASKAEIDQSMRPRLTMARLASRKTKPLAPGSSEDSKQKKVIEELSQEGNKVEAGVAGVIEIDEGTEASGGEFCSLLPLQRTLPVTAAGEVILDIPPKVPQSSGGPDGGPYDSKRKSKELIGPHGAMIPDDAVNNLPFYPTMGAQAFKKYFSPRWEDLASHGDFEDALEASLATAVRTTGMQLKVLGEFRFQMQWHKKLAADASKSEEYKKAMEGLQVAIESMRTTYEQLQADFKEFDTMYCILLRSWMMPTLHKKSLLRPSRR
ncbi:hypothetical protein Adt_23266 [Abeliophyllum distichum]|uniref:Uncharacterized protein n=1 Tax=Abeliophyllum distichum TaxID=126358 RepID=A0ABD1SB86_9LAMI